MKKSLFLLLIGQFFLPTVNFGQRFQDVRYGDDFLSVGAGAGIMGMGSAAVSHSNDIAAAFWNPAGLVHIQGIQTSYMHSERFAGIVKYDYGSIALPVEANNSVIGVSFFRQGVDDIKNTIYAWDAERGQPLPDPTSYFETFSSYDMAFLVSYGQYTKSNMAWGINAKVLNSKIGNFASAWGYSLDFALQDRLEGGLSWGLMLQNATGLFKFWQVNSDAFLDRAEIYSEVIPEGRNERSRPTLKFGLSQELILGAVGVLAAADVDIRNDGREAFYMNLGKYSFEPRAGVQVNIANMLFLRGGVNNFYMKNEKNLMVSPTFGAGLQFKFIALDYAMDNLMGISSALGNTHRISIRVTLADKR